MINSTGGNQVEKEGNKQQMRKSKGWCWWLLVFVIGALVVAATVLTLLRNIKHFKSHRNRGHHPAHIVPKYADALEIAMQFFDVQKCTGNF